MEFANEWRGGSETSRSGAVGRARLISAQIGQRRGVDVLVALCRPAMPSQLPSGAVRRALRHAVKSHSQTQALTFTFTNTGTHIHIHIHIHSEYYCNNQSHAS